MSSTTDIVSLLSEIRARRRVLILRSLAIAEGWAQGCSAYPDDTDLHTAYTVVRWVEDAHQAYKVSNPSLVALESFERRLARLKSKLMPLLAFSERHEDESDG